MALSYAKIEMNLIVMHLATASGNVKERLIEVYPALEKLEANDFPTQFRTEFIQIRHDLTAKGERLDPTKVKQVWTPVQNTLHRKRLSTLSKIAERIFRLNNSIQEL